MTVVLLQDAVAEHTFWVNSTVLAPVVCVSIGAHAVRAVVPFGGNATRASAQSHSQYARMLLDVYVIVVAVVSFMELWCVMVLVVVLVKQTREQRC